MVGRGALGALKVGFVSSIHLFFNFPTFDFVSNFDSNSVLGFTFDSWAPNFDAALDLPCHEDSVFEDVEPNFDAVLDTFDLFCHDSNFEDTFF